MIFYSKASNLLADGSNFVLCGADNILSGLRVRDRGYKGHEHVQS